ncbi:hypothetical protein QQX98_012692 [Neonectria punicea]|uniref:PNPLA domain-containing protein n=1 Tax=Neonectria punicea TaxID=979145 RepID=A0ABR1GIH1_9HYPO
MSLRLLSLDGGGVRGLSSLLILEHLMEAIRDAEKLAEVPRPCERFDMIGGTSTGGIIAIMLGRLGMTVDECIRAYLKMAERAFTRKWTALLPASPGGAFSATKLEEAIRDTVKEFCPMSECVARRRADGLLQPACESTASTCTHGEVEFRDRSCTATVVLAITKDNIDARPTLFTTYGTWEGFKNCTIWEVARATSAATTFFKPIRVGRDKVKFIDAGFGHNNPCEVLIEEAGRHFPDRSLMQIVSIGTGLGDVVSIGNTRRSIIGALKDMATTSKAVAGRLDDHFKDCKPCPYVRFNVEQGLKDTTLSDWKKASRISAHTQNYLNDNKGAIDSFVKMFSSTPTIATIATQPQYRSLITDSFMELVPNGMTWNEHMAQQPAGTVERLHGRLLENTFAPTQQYVEWGINRGLIIFESDDQLLIRDIVPFTSTTSAAVESLAIADRDRALSEATERWTPTFLFYLGKQPGAQFALDRRQSPASRSVCRHLDWCRDPTWRRRSPSTGQLPLFLGGTYQRLQHTTKDVVL